VKFGFIAKHRGIWPAGWLCEALGVSRGGFYAWLTRPRSQRSRSDEELGVKVRASFLASDRTYGARRVWRDLLTEGMSCGLHRIERLMRLQALRARPRRRRLPPDLGERQASAVAPNVLNRTFEASAPNRKWIADFTYVWTTEGWLYVAAVIDLFSRRVVGWSMSAAMTAQLVTDALVMAIWRRGAAISTINAVPRGASLAMISQQLKSVRHLTIAHLQFDCREPTPSVCCWGGTIGICYEFSKRIIPGDYANPQRFRPDGRYLRQLCQTRSGPGIEARCDAGGRRFEI